ncbi:hypothetical protein CEP52_012809 [Fusarium oligoseptatum]|uniref:tRNA N(3)-methylcytidine methyltransferase n=1 Tax=Fusarium oligoseptatum TaxID=2604345 RepID=A0A428SWI7_9HYPO|nr:hypothetical protein CEP52_012809 [Fusarium oligoseptatum]
MASSAPSGDAVVSQTIESVPVEKLASLGVKDPITEADTEAKAPESEVPPHRSHDPANNLKRSDPFQFGSRYLNEGDDVYEFNAWDHVETDDAYKEYAEQQYAKQRQNPVSDFEKRKFSIDPARWWNLFYKNNSANFFKNRKWLQQEFPVLAEVTKEDAGPKVLLEIGAGAGNTAYPILANNKNPELKIHACDYSKTAVEVIRNHEEYDPKSIQADVWDVTSDSLPPGLEEGSVDVAVLIFIFSALSPDQWPKAVSNVHRVLKPGGLLADIWTGKAKELAALQQPSPIAAPAAESADGVEEAEEAETETETEIPQFEIENLGVDRRLLVNRASKLKMYRCWLQGRFRKK